MAPRRSATGEKVTGARNQQTARAGEHFVAAEPNRRGAYAVTFAGNMPGMDILASNLKNTRTVSIQVKTRRVGTWHTSGEEGRHPPKARHFWLFVELNTGGSPGYYIVPDRWMRADIRRLYEPYMRRYKKEKGSPRKSKHQKITTQQIARWKGRWDLLKVF